MSMTYRVNGMIKIVPPLPSASLWELIDGEAFVLASHGMQSSQLAAFVQAREKVFVPAADATWDGQGRPSHIGAAVIDWEARSFSIGHRIRELTRLIVSVRHDFEAELAFQGDDGSAGEIAFFENGDLEWEESCAPDRVPGTFG